jgi:hypothetical protein
VSIENEGSYEAEFEGYLTQFPDTASERNVRAVATIAAKGGDTPNAQTFSNISIEGGTTCNEAGNPEFGVHGSARGTLSFGASAAEPGRVGFPTGNSPTNCAEFRD